MASRIIRFANFFDGNMHQTEKARQLAFLISRATYNAGMDVEATTDDDLIAIIITAEQVRNDHHYQLDLILGEE